MLSNQMCMPNLTTTRSWTTKILEGLESCKHTTVLSVTNAASGEEVLARINAETLQALLPHPPLLSSPPSIPLTPYNDASPSNHPRARHTAVSSSAGVVTASSAGISTTTTAPAILTSGGGGAAHSPTTPFMPLAQHSHMPPAVYPLSGDSAILVGGVNVINSQQQPVHQQEESVSRGNGQRGKDTSKRNPRKCSNCLKLKRTDEEALACPGSAPRGKCKQVQPEADA